MVATLLEMKFKLFSKLFRNKIARLIAIAAIGLAFSALFVYLFGWVWGLILIAGFLVASFGIGYGLRWIAKDATLAALMVMVISFMAFMVISPLSAIAFTSHTLQLASSSAIALALLGFALVASWNIGHNKSLKSTLNAVAVFSVFVCGIYFGLYLNLFWCLVLLVVLSVYDLVAVLWLKTMQVLAKSAISGKLPMMMVFGDEKEIDQKMKNITSSKPQTEQKKQSKSSILGVGDLGCSFFCNLQRGVLLSAVRALAGCWCSRGYDIK